MLNFCVIAIDSEEEILLLPLIKSTKHELLFFIFLKLLLHIDRHVGEIYNYLSCDMVLF